MLIPLAALAFFHRRRQLVLGLAAYCGFIVAAWWLLALRIDRFLVPALPILALLAGAGATWCRDRVWQYALLGLLVLSLVFNFLMITMPPCTYTPLFVRYSILRTTPERLNPWHRYLNENVTGTVLMVGEAQVFDLEVPILYNTWLDDIVFESIVRGPVSGELRPAGEICAELATQNISHVFVAWGEIERYRATGYGNWDFVQPEVFNQLVADSVLELIVPPEELELSPSRAYRVVGSE
jgi:hypothetical protein